MRTTIDKAGRIVIPKPIRDGAGLDPGAEVEIELRDGRIEIEPIPVIVRLVKRGGRSVFVTDADVPPMTTDQVREIIERERR